MLEAPQKGLQTMENELFLDHAEIEDLSLGYSNDPDFIMATSLSKRHEGYVAFGVRAAPLQEYVPLLMAAPLMYQTLTAIHKNIEYLLDACDKGKLPENSPVRKKLHQIERVILNVQTIAKTGEMGEEIDSPKRFGA